MMMCYTEEEKKKKKTRHINVSMLTKQWTADPESVLKGQGRDVSNDIPNLVIVDDGGSTVEGLKIQTECRCSSYMKTLTAAVKDHCSVSVGHFL